MSTDDVQALAPLNLFPMSSELRTLQGRMASCLLQHCPWTQALHVPPRSLEGSGQCGTFSGGCEWDGEQPRARSSSLLSRLGSWLFLEPQYQHQTEFCGSKGQKDLRDFRSSPSLNLWASFAVFCFSPQGSEKFCKIRWTGFWLSVGFFCLFHFWSVEGTTATNTDSCDDFEMSRTKKCSLSPSPNLCMHSASTTLRPVPLAEL